MTTSSIGPGTVLGGRYQLQELLSDHEGARFWRATDTVLVRSVAVHAVSSDDPRADRLLAGARLSATVSDPHILRVLDCDAEDDSGSDDGITWVVNEWGSGVSLDLMLQRGPLPPARAAWLAREVAECIAAAHAQGVPHGCLSPETVLVTEAGTVKLIGFVVAAVLQGPPERDPGYGSLDEREADVVNLAGILYAGLTGRWPGVAPSAVPLAPREGNRLLRPRRVRAGIPRTLDAICTRVLIREGTAHEVAVESAHEIAAALSDYVGDPGAAAPLELPTLHAEPTVSLRLPVAADASDDTVVSNGSHPPEPPPVEATTERTAETGPADTGTHTDPERTQLHDGLLDDQQGREAPPPPPFEDPPERPLFASTERRRNLPPEWPPGGSGSGPASTSGPLSSSGSGTLAPGPDGYWPFGDPAEPVATPYTGKEGRSWLRLAAFVGICLALVVAMAFAFRLGRDNGRPSARPGGGSSPAQAAVSSRVQVVSATAFDPEGDHEENDDEAANAVDDKPGTTWRTSTYYDDPALGGLKSGVGLLLDLGADRPVGSLRIHFVGAPTAVQVYAADPGVSDPPATLDGLRRVADNPSAGQSTVLRVADKTRTRYLVVWLTRLPAVSGGYRGEISSVSVWS